MTAIPQLRGKLSGACIYKLELCIAGCVAWGNQGESDRQEINLHTHW